MIHSKLDSHTKNTSQIPYFSMTQRRPTPRHLNMYGSKCFVLKDNSENVGKFDSKEFEVIFLGYSLESTTYRVFVIEQRRVIESTNLNFDDDKIPRINSEENETLKYKNQSELGNLDEEEDCEDNVQYNDTVSNGNFEDIYTSHEQISYLYSTIKSINSGWVSQNFKQQASINEPKSKRVEK